MGQKGIYKAHVWAQCSMSFRLREPVEHLVPAEQQQNNAAKNFERREYWFQGRKPGQNSQFYLEALIQQPQIHGPR